MSFDMYQQEILDHGKNPRNKRKLKDATATFGRKNPLCGDDVTLYMKADADGTVQEISFDGQGCTISQAAASFFTEHAKGKKLAELEAMTKEDMLKLLGAEITPARHKCATLPLDALHKSHER